MIGPMPTVDRMVHRLKAHPEPFAAVVSGKKTFEYRRNDRAYAVGDELILCEYVPPTTDRQIGRPTGRAIRVKVTYIAQGAYGIPDGYCVMSIKLMRGGE